MSDHLRFTFFSTYKLCADKKIVKFNFLSTGGPNSRFLIKIEISNAPKWDKNEMSNKIT